MLLSILVKELRNHLLTFRFSAALATTFLLVSLSAWALGEDYLDRLNTYNTLSESYAAQAREVYVPSQISPVVHRPPGALEIFARGVEDHLGNSVNIRRWEVPRHAEENLMQNKLLLGLPAFDLLNIFIVVISVFGILLSFDGFCGERENGTLKMICSYPVPRPKLFIAKYLAALVVLAIPFLVSIVSALIVLLFALGIPFSGAQWGAIAMMVIAGLLFGAFFIGAGLLASALARRSSTSLLLALAFWCFVVLIVPSLAPAVAGTLITLPQPQEVRSLEQRTSEELNVEISAWKTKNAPHAGSGYGTSGFNREGAWIFDAPPAWFKDSARFIVYRERLMQERADRIWNVVEKHRAAEARQAALADLLGGISPAHLLRLSCTALAGTDYRAYAAFMDQARRYRSALLDGFARRGYFSGNALSFISRRPRAEIESNDDWEVRRKMYEQRVGSGESAMVIMSITNYAPLPDGSIPPFADIADDPHLADALPSIGLLALSAIFLLSLGYIASIRYDVR